MSLCTWPTRAWFSRAFGCGDLCQENKIVAIGQEAKEMLGRNPESIEVARPCRTA